LIAGIIMPRIGGFLPRLELVETGALLGPGGVIEGRNGTIVGRDENPARDSLRAVLLLVLFAITWFAVMLSTIFKRRLASSHRLISLLSCVGAGVFLGACLLDLLPDALEHFEKSGVEMSFPLAEASVGAGFLMVLTLEQVALFIQEKRFREHAIDLHGHSHLVEEEDGDGEDSQSHHSPSEPPPALPAIMLVLSLSLHSLFEGLSLAVIPEASKLLQVFGALFIHKSLIGLSLGVRLVGSTLRPLVVAACAFVFSVQVLIGGLGGIWLNHVFSGPAGVLTAACLQGIACGTFLFVTTMEILPHEIGHANSDFRLLRLLFVFAGCGLIILFMLIFPEAG
ncbi:zipt-1, partial [Pristionchus pacificus]